MQWRRYPTSSADYEVRFAGTDTLTPSVSRRIPVTVTPAATTLRVSATPSNPAPGSTVTIGARLVRTDNGAVIGGEPVTLYARLVGSTTYRRIGTKTTSATGFASWTDRPRADTVYVVKYYGSARWAPSSGGRTVDVR